MRTLTIKSSVVLTDEQKSNLEKGIQSQETEKIIFQYIIEKNISGIKILDNDQLLDVSNIHSLSKLKKDLDDYLFSLQKGISVSQIPELIKTKLKDFKKNTSFENCGKVIAASDGIVQISGLTKCKYKEILLIGNKGFALAMNLEEEQIGAILLSDESTAQYGDMVYSTNKIIEVPVGYEFLGRIIDPLGNPIDGRPQISSQESYHIENPAPRIIDRAKVDEPLYTGILAIDTMIPIGKGQRELIIGDRQTGKTSLVIDTIINQKNKNVYCIYVAIGQRVSTVKKIVKTLEEQGAMAYTTVIVSTASDLASLQYIAPYTGAALADFLMYKGEDVLIVYDDLSKHAVAYRTISLLLKRPAGREAFPGDIFYIHSELLERSAKLSPSLGGGSVTALPIIETQAGDISAYIPTNVISITDGQIYLEKELFNSGQRPAINVGLSVSRIGGSAQKPLMRKLSSHLRLDIAHYRELAMFSQFGSSLDNLTKDILENGVKINEAICQPECAPYSFLREIIYLYTITNKYLKEIPLKKIIVFLDLLYNYILEVNPDLCLVIEKQGDLSEEQLTVFDRVVKEFISYYLGEK